MSEDHARLVWRPEQHRAGGGSTALSFNKNSGNVSVKGLCSKKHLVQITLKRCFSPPLYGRGGLSTKGSLGLFFLLFSNFWLLSPLPPGFDMLASQCSTAERTEAAQRGKTLEAGSLTYLEGDCFV